MTQTISKTSFLAGTQCPKLLWKKLNEREVFPPVSEAKQAIFDQGHAVGELAKTLYPGGIEVGEGVVHREQAAEETGPLLARRVPLYEPAFTFGDGFARVDILIPDGPDGWRIVEVKSGTKVKPENELDVAFQWHVCAGAGLKITRCSLMHVNSGYVRNGPVDPAGLMKEEDITEEVQALLPEIPERLAELSRAASTETCPNIPIGPHCTSPYTCDLQDQCRAFLPKYPVTDLCNDKKGLRWALLEDGIEALTDIPASMRLNLKHKIQVEAARSGQPHVSPMALKRRLNLLQWPVALFDIETIFTAIPLFDGTRPYQQVPFQFSLHVQQGKSMPITHHEFLANGRDDPRPAFLEALKACLPKRGSIVAYNSSFEYQRLKECAHAFPEHAWANDAGQRLHDILVPFNKFWYHHPDQHGSASLKAVLPCVTGSSYSHLAIQDGQAAARAFVKAEFDDIPAKEREQIRTDLLAYCKLDTQAMVDLLDALRQHAAK